MAKRNRSKNRDTKNTNPPPTYIDSGGGDIAMGDSFIDKREGDVFIETSSNNQVSRVRPSQQSKRKESTSIFVTIPKAIGRFVLDVFGRDKATSQSATILGYILIVVVGAVAIGLIDLTTLTEWFKYNWRFFFPPQ